AERRPRRTGGNGRGGRRARGRTGGPPCQGRADRRARPPPGVVQRDRFWRVLHAPGRMAAGAVGGARREAPARDGRPPRRRTGPCDRPGRPAQGAGRRTAGRGRRGRARRLPPALRNAMQDNDDLHTVATFLRRLQWALVALATCWLLW